MAFTLSKIEVDNTIRQMRAPNLFIQIDRTNCKCYISAPHPCVCFKASLVIVCINLLVI